MMFSDCAAILGVEARSTCNNFQMMLFCAKRKEADNFSGSHHHSIIHHAVVQVAEGGCVEDHSQRQYYKKVFEEM